MPLADVPALTGAILRLLREPAQAAQMGAASRRLAAERFDEREVFEKVKGEYARLLREKGRALPTRSPAKSDNPLPCTA